MTNAGKTKGAPASFHVLRWLWQVTGLYKTGVAVLFVVQVTFGVCGVASAMLFRALIDGAVGGAGGAIPVGGGVSGGAVPGGGSPGFGRALSV